MVKEYIFLYSTYAIIIYLFAIITYEYKIMLKYPLVILFVFILVGAAIASCRPTSTQDTELYNLAKANGVNVADDIVEKYNGIFSKLHYDAITSLYRDIRAGKTNTEFNSIIGKAYKMAVKTGIECPCITKTYNKYKVL